jgi:hypothetical protein
MLSRINNQMDSLLVGEEGYAYQPEHIHDGLNKDGSDY